MEERERIKAKISEAMQDFQQDAQKIENEMQELQKGLRIALSLYETAQRISKGDNEKIKSIEYMLLDSLQAEFAQWYTEYKTLKSGKPAEWVQDIKPVMDVMKLYYALIEEQENDTQAQSGVCMPDLPAEIRQEVETILQNPNDSGRSYILDNPAMKKITRSKDESGKRIDNIMLSSRENAMITIIDGYLTPYEREILETIMKCKQDGQVTQKGKIFCTVGQIYRGVRGGGEQSPTKAQKEDIMNDLRELEANNRKITFELANAQTIFEEFEMQGGRLRILSFDEFWGKIRGQDETLIVFDDTPLLMMISEKLGMFESVSQDIKRIQEEYLTLKLDNGKTIKGTTQECQKKLAKQGKSRENIVEADRALRNMALSKNRIAMRNVIISFVWSYMGARGANPPKPHSNKINYADIFAQCEIGQTWQEKDRAKNAIYSILDHLKRHEVIKSWKEYTNAGDKGASGVQFSIDSNNLIGGE